jgi:DNA-binding CsgD family transcriptional regulator
MKSEKDESHLEFLLRERIKELDCLYGMAKLIEQHENSIDKIIQGIVEILPDSWQYPDITCARILFNHRSYQSRNFRPSQWKPEAAIVVSAKQVGTVEVYYFEKKPTLDEGPFLKEERLLINAVSGRIAKAAESINAQRQLQVEQQALQDANIAIHEALTHSQREKKMIGVSIQSNVDKIILPILFAMQSEMDPRQIKYMDLLKKNLEDIVSPFVEQDHEIPYKLSPVELLICNMIKHGLSTKNIANIRRISPSTVNRHRESIRRKLGLTNRKVNLVSYLNNIAET